MSSTKQKQTLLEADLGPRRTSKMELLVKKFNGFRPLTLFPKSSIWDVTAFSSDFYE